MFGLAKAYLAAASDWVGVRAEAVESIAQKWPHVNYLVSDGLDLPQQHTAGLALVIFMDALQAARGEVFAARVGAEINRRSLGKHVTDDFTIFLQKVDWRVRMNGGTAKSQSDQRMLVFAAIQETFERAGRKESDELVTAAFSVLSGLYPKLLAIAHEK